MTNSKAGLGRVTLASVHAGCAREPGTPGQLGPLAEAACFCAGPAGDYFSSKMTQPLPNTQSRLMVWISDGESRAQTHSLVLNYFISQIYFSSPMFKTLVDGRKSRRSDSKMGDTEPLPSPPPPAWRT